MKSLVNAQIMEPASWGKTRGGCILRLMQERDAPVCEGVFFLKGEEWDRNAYTDWKREGERVRDTEEGERRASKTEIHNIYLSVTASASK
jgi:hypothetical protein